MDRDDLLKHRLDQLRRFRNRPERDLSLSFMADQFRRQVARPFKQLQSITALWSQLVPADLLPHTRLEGLTRGVLHVAVDSSAARFELDRALRSGLQTQLIQQHKGPAIRRVNVRVRKSVDS